MKRPFPIWLVGLLITIAVIAIPVAIFLPKAMAPRDNPAASLTTPVTHTSHANLMEEAYATGQDVTRACLECHPDAASEFMKTTHWTWESAPVDVPWRDSPVTIGKMNQINNFCIGAQGNQKKCMSCHTGYGWSEDIDWQSGGYDLTNPLNVDCLVCHADTASYARSDYGNPAEGIDLTVAAQSVRNPTRDNCGKCHFDGGGGNGVKHGDLDESLYFPSENLDVHMGRQDFQCTQCHKTTDHQVLGRMIADNFTIDPAEQVACTNCHSENLHEDERITAHIDAVACQTCHIPAIATKDPTKTLWDWSTAGQDLGDDHYTYLKIKGSFVYEKDFKPAYEWFNGSLAYRYLLGDTIDPSNVTYINKPAGELQDPISKIFPFKIHVAKQPYDTVNNHLLQPITAGDNGYWTNFDWDNAFELAQDTMGLEYSGEYGFTETWMYWPTTHMVQPQENALQCTDCHSTDGRMDWQALGYPGDPMEWGGRFSK